MRGRPRRTCGMGGSERRELWLHAWRTRRGNMDWRKDGRETQASCTRVQAEEMWWAVRDGWAAMVAVSGAHQEVYTDLDLCRMCYSPICAYRQPIQNLGANTEQEMTEVPEDPLEGVRSIPAC
jgi:hypothetical protein